MAEIIFLRNQKLHQMQFFIKGRRRKKKSSSSFAQLRFLPHFDFYSTSFLTHLLFSGEHYEPIGDKLSISQAVNKVC